jgi:soluble lytic murein transglycosylase-like protein
MADLVQLAKTTAVTHGLDPALVCAVVEQESNWNPWAVRAEPRFLARYVAPLKLSDTESWTRSQSFGLMQIMGEVARELGFKEPYLTELCDPVHGLEFGCRKLKQCVQRANLAATADGFDALEQSLLYWNGGSDTDYPAQVKARMGKYGTNNPTS